MADLGGSIAPFLMVLRIPSGMARLVAMGAAAVAVVAGVVRQLYVSEEGKERVDFPCSRRTVSCLVLRVEDSCTGQTMKEMEIGLEYSTSLPDCSHSAGTYSKPSSGSVGVPSPA